MDQIGQYLAQNDPKCIFCISDTFIAKETKDIRLVQQQTEHLCKCKYVSNDYASWGPPAWWPKSLAIWKTQTAFTHSKGLLFEFLLLILPRAKNFLCKSLIALSLGTLTSGNWTAKSAGSPGRKFLVPLLLWNSIARKDRWGWLNCGLGGIFVLESLSWAKEYNIELEKQQNNLGKIHHMCSHIYFLWEKGLVFYLYLQEFHMDFSLPTVIFAMAFLTKGSFFRHPLDSDWLNIFLVLLCLRTWCYIFLEVRPLVRNSSSLFQTGRSRMTILCTWTSSSEWEDVLQNGP